MAEARIFDRLKADHDRHRKLLDGFVPFFGGFGFHSFEKEFFAVIKI